MNISNIYEGWRNNLFPPEELKEIITEVSLQRMEICDACEFHSKNHKTLRPDDHCTKCSCPLVTKTKCLSCSCPFNKWEAVLTEDQQIEIENAK